MCQQGQVGFRHLLIFSGVRFGPEITVAYNDCSESCFPHLHLGFRSLGVFSIPFFVAGFVKSTNNVIKSTTKCAPMASSGWLLADGILLFHFKKSQRKSLLFFLRLDFILAEQSSSINVVCRNNLKLWELSLLKL